MGIIKALVASTQGVLEDQWKEFFSCGELPADVLARRGYKSTSDRSANHGDDNIISDGSVVALFDGQAMVVVEAGKVIDYCTEAGSYTINTASPTIFHGGLKNGLTKSVKEVGRRFTFGGDVARIQRIYFFNTKEITGNLFETQGSIPIRTVDKRSGLDIDISVNISGVYSYKIVDPALFYKNVCGNVGGDYLRSEIDSQLKSEFLTALQEGVSAVISDKGLRYSSMPEFIPALTWQLNRVLSPQWEELRGIKIAGIGISVFSAPGMDAKLLKEMQRNQTYTDPTRAAASLVGAQGDAMQSAAANPAGAGIGMAAMGMAGGGGQQTAQMQSKKKNKGNKPKKKNTNQSNKESKGWTCSCGQKNNPGQFCIGCGKPKPVEESWDCGCGQKGNKSKFCIECGKPKPVIESWDCSCGQKGNKSKFCIECGKPKPVEKSWDCSCGQKGNKSKFCVNCGAARP